MTDLRLQLQDHLGDGFRIERELGGGGMSRVFLATEVRLSRQVVIKLLSPELAQGLNAERFEREILLVASLQQANIVPVLAAGDLGGLPYFTMPYVDGESLRHRIGTGLPIDDVVTILRDVARALSYAHQRGIVHRDIKPDNVLLSGGAAVVTDFGIAKALAASQRPELAGDLPATLTMVGSSIGTPAYMAPEQVAGDPNLDHRVDLYALGCMAFEMLTGKSPFAEHVPQRMLAAHLSETPVSVETLRPDCPPALALLVARLLEKDPADRVAQAQDVVQALGAVGTTSSETNRLSPEGRMARSLGIWAVSALAVWIVARAAVVGIGLPGWTVTGAVGVMLLGLPVLLFTGWAKWEARRAATATPTLTPGGTRTVRPSGTMTSIAIRANRHLSFRRATRGGLVAMAAFVLLVAGFMVTRAMGIGPAASLFATGSLTNQDRVLLADFAMGPTDSALAPIIQEAVRAAMSQSTVVRLLDAAEVESTLELMERAPDTRIDGEVARDLAQRAGAKAILGGRLVRGADGYFLSIELRSPISGQVLKSVQTRARGDDQLLSSVGRAVEDLRSKIGESLKQVQKTVPLERATTADLEALRLYTEGTRANRDFEFARAVELTRAAVARDSTFALAWRKLAVALDNMNAPRASRDSALEQAARYADKLPDRERHLVMAQFYLDHSTLGDPAKSFDAYKAAYRADSNDITSTQRLSTQYVRRAIWDSAVRYATREFTLEASRGAANRLSMTLLATGQPDAASRLLDSLRAASTAWAENASLDQPVAVLYQERGQDDSLARYLDSLQRAPLGRRPFISSMLSRQAFKGGRLRDAIRHDSALGAALTAAGLPAQPDGMASVVVDLTFRGNPARAIRTLNAVVREEFPTRQVADRDYSLVARRYARAGEPGVAREMLARFAREDSSRFHDPGSQAAIRRTEGEIALAEGRHSDAVRWFRHLPLTLADSTRQCEMCIRYDLGRTFAAAGQADSAIAQFEAFLAMPTLLRDGSVDPEVTKALGDLYDARGDRTNALKYYGQFVEMWRNADPELQPAVTSVRRRIAELASKEGRGG